MKKTLLILFLAVALSGCEKEETEVIGKAFIKSVTFQPIAGAGTNLLRVTINLSMPEKGSVIQIDAARGQQSRFKAIGTPVDGSNSFFDNSIPWPPSESTLFYVFTLKHLDGTETVSKPYSLY